RIGRVLLLGFLNDRRISSLSSKRYDVWHHARVGVELFVHSLEICLLFRRTPDATSLRVSDHRLQTICHTIPVRRAFGTSLILQSFDKIGFVDLHAALSCRLSRIKHPTAPPHLFKALQCARLGLIASRDLRR